MHHAEHTRKSLERLKNHNETSLYSTAPKIIENIIIEVHKSLDSFLFLAIIQMKC